jgi:hypothetical protein
VLTSTDWRRLQLNVLGLVQQQAIVFIAAASLAERR